MKNILMSVVVAGFLTANISVLANDFDDGMSMDSGINDSLGVQRNTAFSKRNTKHKVARGQAIVLDPCAGVGNMNFVGSNLRGATIVNMSDNRGVSNNCNKK